MKEAAVRTMRAELDLLAHKYRARRWVKVANKGDDPDYFAEYKIADLATFVRSRGLAAHQILDFGSGMGSSIPFFRKYFANSEVRFSDTSQRSLEVAQARYPGPEKHLLIGGEIPLPARSQDIVFSACVFNHIPHTEHYHWLAELHRVARKGALLVIYEHNPLNPLTVRAFNSLEVDARLIRAAALRRLALLARWDRAEVDYKLFFRSPLKSLRPLERHLGWLGCGAQYRLSAVRA